MLSDTTKKIDLRYKVIINLPVEMAVRNDI